MNMSKRKLKILTIAEKVDVIKTVERGGKKNYEVANEFGIPSSTLSTILKNKTKILTNFESQPGRKKIKSAEFPNLDSSLLKWFVQRRDSNVYVNGPKLKEKADSFAKSLGYSRFKNSAGWLDKWKKRNNISLKRNNNIINNNKNKSNSKPREENVHSTSACVKYLPWKLCVSNAIDRNSPDDISNANETNLPICGAEIMSEIISLAKDTGDNDGAECSTSKGVTLSEAAKALDVLRDFFKTTEGKIS